MDKDTIEFYRIAYFQNDEPVPYKLKCGYTINIYPISVKDWDLFEKSLTILSMNKNEINDADVIRMSYLQFVMERIVAKDDNYKSMLFMVLEKSLHESNFGYMKDNNKPLLLISDENDICKATITHKEFDEICQIIKFYNIIGYDDRYVSKDLQKVMDDYYRIKYKDSHIPILEERKCYFIGKTGLKMQDINAMSYRSFCLTYQSQVDDDMYFANKMIQASFKYDVKDDINHPLFTKKKDRFDEILQNKDSFVNKVNSVNI